MGYIDDSCLQGDTKHECQTNITDTCCLFMKLGFIIHPVKSVLQPVQTLVLLGFVLHKYEICTYTVYSDNTTTVNINSMGGTHSIDCNSVCQGIWLCCITREIWLSAAHIPGKDNFQADKESRGFHDNKEWMLRPDIFQQVTKLSGNPSSKA